MKKILTIASREYNAVVRSEAFVISIILLPVMMLASVPGLTIRFGPLR